MKEPAEEMECDVAGDAVAADDEAVAANDEVVNVVVKQEPQEVNDEMMVFAGSDEVMDASFAGEDEYEHRAYPHLEEISNDILLRAVSPPTYADHCDPEELMLFYKEKYQLKDLKIIIDDRDITDGLAESFALCRQHQKISNNDNSSYQADSPQNSDYSHSQSPIPTISYQPTIGNNNSALPDFRFSVKSKKKLYHCVSCGKEYSDSSQLQQHAFQEHGVFVSPKRIYKPRPDMVAKANRERANGSAEGYASGSQSPMVKIPLSQTSLPELNPPGPSVETLNTEDTENSTLIDNAIPQPVAKTSKRRSIEKKARIRCVLCKRVCTDIVYHMKGYHKVGCVSSIIAQCEKIDDDVPETDKVEVPIPAEEDVPMEYLPMEVDLQVPLSAPIKRKKRIRTRWTIPKRKFKQSAVKLARMPKSSQPLQVGASKKYKCHVCQGIYKTSKSFSHHRSLHQDRGETAENFDPSKCRFLNSPLRTQAKLPKEILSNYVRSQRQVAKVQPSITDYLTTQMESTKPALKAEDPSVPTVTNENPAETARSCECGRSFRNYHTLYLHKVKCQETDGKSINHDSDSGVGISIKIKKKNDDSYEVVSRTTPTEDNFKESRSCKDSDASSNDSGVVSVGSNRREADTSQSANYKTHSVMRIRVEEKDEEEEVDIEDENSNQSNLNENCCANSNGQAEDFADAASSPSAVDDSGISSLKNLCTEVMSKSKDKTKTSYKCLTCLSYFENTTDLMEHVSNAKHDTKSLCSCGKEFKSLKYYNIHVRRFHPDLLKCSYCSTNFDRIEKYLGHKCHVAEGALFIEPIIQTQCTKCKELVDLGEPFDKHMRSHFGDAATLYQCYRCDLTFDNPYQRRSHFSHEHGFSPCRICGKVLHIDHLSRHDAYHDGLGHPCHLCKKTFSQKTLLRKHVQDTHDSLASEIVRCIVCSKSVKMRCLKKHMSFHLHTEICKKCNKCVGNECENGREEDVATDYPNESSIDKCSETFATDREYDEHCQEGSSENNTNDDETTVQAT